MRASVQWTHHIISLLYILCTWYLLDFGPRENVEGLFFIFAASSVCYLLILNFKQASFKYILNVAILTHVGALLFLPQLSNDIYRFLWDGAITWMGENPFDSTPNELWTQSQFNSSDYLASLRYGMSDLSKENYTCYPTINQCYFIVANAFSDSVVLNSFVLKILIVLTQAAGIYYLIKLLQHFKLSIHRIFILLLNPLWLLETVVNSHFEGVMLSFFVIGLYFLIQKKWILGALLIALAIHVKLVPIFLLPFLFRYLGWAKSTLVYSAIAVFLTLLGLVYLDATNVMHFLESITLYFKAFEFNSFLYYHYLEYGFDVYGWYPIRTFGYQLSKISTFLILSLSVYGDFYDFQTMVKRMMFAVLIYYIFATTVHPWYILSLLGLSIFSNFSFGIVWSLIIVVSYASYGDYSDGTLRNLITAEYLILFAVVIYELIFRKALLNLPVFHERSESLSGTGS